MLVAWSEKGENVNTENTEERRRTQRRMRPRSECDHPRIERCACFITQALRMVIG
jgi:hypothetical protein